jgi:hypothetical protein
MLKILEIIGKDTKNDQKSESHKIITRDNNNQL